MWIKICANTNVEDALLACELGADAVGFVFAPSKRQVTAQQAREIAFQLPAHIERVGVFTTTDVDEIRRTADYANLSAIQLHGEVNLKLAAMLRGDPREGHRWNIINTVHWSVDKPGMAASIASRLQDANDVSVPGARILVDSKIGSNSGGLGERFDWTQARSIFRSYPNLNLIVAGGLTPENVAEAIQELKPWGVDVASGVESKPGKKDPERLKRFIAAARGLMS